MSYQFKDVEKQVYDCIKEISNEQGICKLTDENNQYICDKVQLMPDQVNQVCSRLAKIGALKLIGFTTYVINE